MASDKENILNNLLSPGTYLECSDYFTHLGALSLEELFNEPARLKVENNELLKQTQDLGFSNYKTFIQTAECSKSIFQKFKTTEDDLQNMITTLPELSKQCHELSAVTGKVNASRELNTRVLAKHRQLLEILELPQLMESCIRSGEFEKALELSAYVKRLGKKHGHIPIIAKIMNEFNTPWQATLLAELRTNLQLPRCLQIVGYLRRMEVYTEAELRLKFLQASDFWFQKLLQGIPKTNGIDHILKTIELTRIHLFNIITQYRAIFSDQDPIVSITSDSSVNETQIFYSWITEKISNFINSLDETELSKNIASLDSVIAQSMYFGQSFSRVGCDFRGLLARKFIRVVELTFEGAVVKANKNFDERMEKLNVKKISLSSVMRSSVEQPPMSLLEYDPLAHYLNSILTAFNDMRECAPLACAHVVTSLLTDSLRHCSDRILLFYKQEHQAFEEQQRDKFTQLCGGFQTLVRYVQQCLEKLFPAQQVANHIGIPVHQLQKEQMLNINEVLVMEPLAGLLPVQPVIVESEETSPPVMIPVE